MLPEAFRLRIDETQSSRNPASEKFSNVARFTVMAFLRFPNLLTP